VELLLIIRVCSLYGHHKLVTWSLGCLFVVSLIGAAVSLQLYVRSLQTALYYKFLPGCWYYWDNYLPVDYSWIPLLTLEGILVLLTAYKWLSFRNTMNRTIAVLSRDSVVYFIIVGAFIALAVAGQWVPVPFLVTVPVQCSVSIAAGRMMMNLRGLIAEDPEHTIHLQPIQFATQANSDTDTEDELTVLG